MTDAFRRFVSRIKDKALRAELSAEAESAGESAELATKVAKILVQQNEAREEARTTLRPGEIWRFCRQCQSQYIDIPEGPALCRTCNKET